MSVSLKTIRAAYYALIAFVLIAILYKLSTHSLKLAFIAQLLPIVVIAFLFLKAREQSARARYLRESVFPKFLHAKLRLAHPGFTAKDTDLVEHGLRQFFIANAKSKGKFVAMPSKVADEMWHEFILHTKGYEAWCKQAFGKLLHHTPAEALSRSAERNDGLRRAWFWACKEESIDPRNPSRLPLLFALDKKLGIEGGFTYVPDCRDIARKSNEGGDGGMIYCGTSFSDGSSSGGEGGYSGDANSFGGAEGGSSADGGSDGGGDGGGGCGGGGD